MFHKISVEYFSLSLDSASDARVFAASGLNQQGQRPLTDTAGPVQGHRHAPG
jgi:hypothetical protein